MLTDLGSLAGLRGHSGLERARAQAKATRRPRPMLQPAAAPTGAPPPAMAAAATAAAPPQPDPAAQEQGLADGGMVVNDTLGATGGPYPTLPASVAPLFTSTPSQGAAFTNLSQIGGNGSAAAPLTRIVTPADIAALFSGSGKPGFSSGLPASLVHLTDPRPAAPGTTAKAPPVGKADSSVQTGTAGGSAGDGTAATSDGAGGNSQSDNPANSEGVTNGGTRTDPGMWGTAQDPDRAAYNGLKDAFHTAMSIGPAGPITGALAGIASNMVDQSRQNPNQAPSLGQAIKDQFNPANTALGRLAAALGLTTAAPDQAPQNADEQSFTDSANNARDSFTNPDGTTNSVGREDETSRDATVAGRDADAGQTDQDGGDRRGDRDNFGSGLGGNDGGNEGNSGHEGHENDTSGGEGDGGSGNARTGGRIDQRMFAGKLRGPGTPTSDSIPTSLPNGRPGPRVSRDEFVVNGRTTRRLSNGQALYELQRQSDLHPDMHITPADIAALFRR